MAGPGAATGRDPPPRPREAQAEWHEAWGSAPPTARCFQVCGSGLSGLAHPGLGHREDKYPPASCVRFHWSTICAPLARRTSSAVQRPCTCSCVVMAARPPWNISGPTCSVVVLRLVALLTRTVMTRFQIYHCWRSTSPLLPELSEENRELY